MIWSFEGIKQAALMGGNAALKILPFVCKAFLLLLLGQVQRMESAFQALHTRCSFLQPGEQRSESEIRAATDKALSTNELSWAGEFILDVFLPEACFK